MYRQIIAQQMWLADRGPRKRTERSADWQLDTVLAKIAHLLKKFLTWACRHSHTISEMWLRAWLYKSTFIALTSSFLPSFGIPWTSEVVWGLETGCQVIYICMRGRRKWRRTIRMYRRDSTCSLQIGHLDVCFRSSCAHSWHMHMWRQGNTVVSLSFTKQITQSLSSSASAVWTGVTRPCTWIVFR